MTRPRPSAAAPRPAHYRALRRDREETSDGPRRIQLTGDSGHAFHSNHDDQLGLWRTGRTLPMGWDRTVIAAEAAQTLTLEP